jgi:hypothetical protein
VGAAVIFRAGVPELTSSADIKLNERLSLRCHARNYFAVLRNEHRIGKAEAVDRIGDLPDLLLRMRTRVSGVRTQVI